MSLRSALQSRDPERVASALDLPLVDSTKSSGSGGSLRSHKERLIDPTDGVDWSAVLTSWMDACEAARRGEVEKCYEAQSSLHSSLNHVFASSHGNWLVPALHMVCRNTHRVGLLAYERATRKDESKMKNAVNLLQESFSRCLNDRKEFQPNAPLSEEGSKKAGVLYIVNQLFAMYFRLNTLRLCKNILRPVESRNLHIHGRKGDMVTYRYFVGRLYMFEDHYDLAETNLDYALKHCRKDALKNKRCILQYLVPVKMLRGRLANPALLEKYDLKEFLPLVQGIRSGDLRTFNGGLEKHEDLFIRRGIILLLEKCKSVCYRNFFKRVHALLPKPHLPLPDIARTMKWMDIPMDLDEIECIMANLIFRGYIRGYISHTKRVLVLSKTNPFPTSAVIVKSE